MLRLAGKLVWVRPKALEADCIGCTLCATSCPVDAIAMVERLPVIEYAQCINCISCQEVCPTQAMRAETSPIVRLFAGSVR
jgi:formate hydrogenlyase subunit 6/NADH:ubiquinone oxidoreductase subunit I